MEDKTVTLIVTSCGRPDLLKETLDSFDLFNTYPLTRKVLIEDSADSKMEQFLSKHYKGYFDTIIINKPKLGHMKSIDRAYQEVGTPYIFHCEDDWEFIKKGFIEDSFLLLDQDPKLLNIYLRGVSENNVHQLDSEIMVFENKIKYRRVLDVVPGQPGQYRGFTLNPTLKRLSDYHLIGSYAAVGSEHALVREYQNFGYHAISFEEAYIRHIGAGRHVPRPTDSWLRRLKLKLRNKLKSRKLFTHA